MKITKSLATASLALILLAACGSVGDVLGGGSDQDYEIRGTVESVDLNSRSVWLSNVTGYTASMLSNTGGKTVLLNLWATWCFPCREEMPALDALQKEAGSDTFEVIAVNVDTGDDVKPKKFLVETGIDTLGYYRDNTLGLFNDLKKRGLALGLPVTLLIDSEGCLLAHMNGPADWAGEDARRLIAAAGG